MKTDREKLSITKDILVCLAAVAFVIDNLAILAVLVGEILWP